MKKLTTIILLLLAIKTYAQTPLGEEFTYQGELNDTSGVPYDGVFDFKFVAFDAKNDATGNNLGTFIAEDIVISNGVFTTQIDYSILGDEPFMGDKVWLEIHVQLATDTNNFKKLLPRQQITATPYAIHAQFVSEDAISHIEIQDGSVTASELASSSVTTQKIANSSITDIKLADNSVTTDKIVTDGVTFEKIANNSINSKRVIDGSLKAVDIDNEEIQQRINGSCVFPEYLTSISQAGNVICARMPIGAANTLDSVGNIKLYTSIAIGADNNPIISYYDDRSDNLRIVKCSNPSCSTFNTPVTIDSAGDVGAYTSIAIGDDNNPIISYYDNTNGDLKTVKCNNPSCSTFNTPVTLDSAGTVGEFTSIAIGADNNPVISYYDIGNSNLKIVKCNNPSCSITNTPETLDSAGDVGRYTSIAIGTDNNPIISYNLNGVPGTGANDYLKIVKCSNQGCSATNTPVSLGSTGVAGEHTSIAIGADGNPVISYYSTGDLKIIKCTIQDCSTFNPPVTLDSAGVVGRYNSIAIGADNNPIISYSDDINGALKIVKCTLQWCAAFNTPVTLDTVGDAGKYTSIAIGADGRPIISYFKQGANDFLKVYSCGDQECQN